LLANLNPGGCEFSASSILIETPINLRSDKARPETYLPVRRNVHMKDSVMDVVVASSLTNYLFSSSKISDLVLRKVENAKFTKDLKFGGPIKSSTTMRMVFLALNKPCGIVMKSSLLCGSKVFRQALGNQARGRLTPPRFVCSYS
jgi:hypothetical protein